MVQSAVRHPLLRYSAWLPFFIAVLIGGIFLCDLFTPASVIVSMLYGLPIYLCRFLPQFAAVPVTAVLCTALTLIAWHVSPQIGVPWVVAVNRLLTVLLIWGTAYLTRQIKVLYGYIRICSACKRIADAGRWVPWEIYIARHSEADFTHGMCEECIAKLYPEASRAVSRKFPSI